MKEFWDSRYIQNEFAYGERANIFLQEQLVKWPAGKLLCPAEGEGRNAVFSAKLGWQVSAFDISVEGKKKAGLLADKNHVTFDYQVGELDNVQLLIDYFDAMVLIYAHFPANEKIAYHHQLNKSVKVGGIIIFEAFSKKHLDYILKNEKVGGPRDLDTLFSVEEIKMSFPNYEILLLEETEIELNEGLYHQGTGSVIRFIGRKLVD